MDPLAPDPELLRDLWAECADDLRRMARAFDDPVGLTRDAASRDALIQLADTFADRVRDTHEGERGRRG